MQYMIDDLIMLVRRKNMKNLILKCVTPLCKIEQMWNMTSIFKRFRKKNN